MLAVVIRRSSYGVCWAFILCNIIFFSFDLSLWAQVCLSCHLECGDYATVIFLLHICWVSLCLVVAVLHVSFYYGGVVIRSFIVVLVSVRPVFPGLVRVRVCSCAAAVVAWWCFIFVITAEIHPCSCLYVFYHPSSMFPCVEFPSTHCTSDPCS